MDASSSLPEMRHADFILVGGGLASATAAETLRAEGATGSILLLCAEGLYPYHRPPLSKQALLGTGDNTPSFIHPEKFYREHAIEVHLNTRVVSVDSARQSVTTEAGEQISYGQLLIATGAIPKWPSIPGITLSGIHTLRARNDADTIRQAAMSSKDAVVLGGSFLGMEIAFSLRNLGLQVSIIERSSALLTHLQAPELSEYFRRYAENRGISIVLEDTAAAVHGDGRVSAVETVAGRRIPCDLLVVSMGVGPASDFLAGSGITLRDGWVAVDSLLRTNVPNVFAAGDITVFDDPVFARPRHIEHWDNAVKQGRLAARNMVGRRLRYDELSYFYCEFGDVGFDVLGAPEEADQRIARGSMDTRSCALFYLRDDVLRALFSMGRQADETRVAEGLIRYRVNLHAVKDKLSEPTFPLDATPAQTALILQGGGALGAFECGVVKALEETQIFPDIVAGVSIGAINGAIIAGNPRHATQALESFWNELAIVTPQPGPVLDVRDVTALNVLVFGVPKFFTPRWMLPFAMAQPPVLWTSYYDTAPMHKLISTYVDFPKLKSSPVRLLISAVNIETAELETFDSFVDDLTADHVLASGSLPPGLPWTRIGGNAYWDGAIISNSPLDLVFDRCGPDGKRVFIVDLFGGKKPLPSNMMDVMARRDEIVYSERVRSDLRYRETVEAYRRLIQDVLVRLDATEIARIRRDPRYIQLMGDGAATIITRLVRPGEPGERSSRDYDFSDGAIAANKLEGYRVAKLAIGQP
jgi:NADPH-dependent 2,4-dienoyl-CoA reductase/sulfur reductase-like enzyme/predicted acylesterase/phospholipase RssA